MLGLGFLVNCYICLFDNDWWPLHKKLKMVEAKPQSGLIWIAPCEQSKTLGKIIPNHRPLFYNDLDRVE